MSSRPKTRQWYDYPRSGWVTEEYNGERWVEVRFAYDGYEKFLGHNKRFTPEVKEK